MEKSWNTKMPPETKSTDKILPQHPDAHDKNTGHHKTLMKKEVAVTIIIAGLSIALGLIAVIVVLSVGMCRNRRQRRDEEAEAEFETKLSTCEDGVSKPSPVSRTPDNHMTSAKDIVSEKPFDKRGNQLVPANKEQSAKEIAERSQPKPANQPATSWQTTPINEFLLSTKETAPSKQIGNHISQEKNVSKASIKAPKEPMNE